MQMEEAERTAASGCAPSAYPSVAGTKAARSARLIVVSLAWRVAWRLALACLMGVVYAACKERGGIGPGAGLE